MPTNGFTKAFDKTYIKENNMPTLNWIGKDKVVTHHKDVPFNVLEHQYGFRADAPEDKSPTKSGNMIIHGDNLYALKSLLPQYEGRIKCIYIDPPYNTGEEKWVYNDNVNDPRILKWLGEVVGKEGEDFTRHDKWACMMYPRLVLMQKLLSEDGVIFISNDDNENSYLKLICNEIFGVNNFVSNISWQRTYSVRNDSKSIMNEVENILVYSKNPGWSPNKLERTEDMNKGYKNPDNDPKGLWQSVSIMAPGAATHQGMVYAIQNPFSGEMMYPTNGRCWSFGQDQMLELMHGWCEYEYKNINDTSKRAEICGVDMDIVKQDVCAIVLKKTLEESRDKALIKLQEGNWPKLFFSSNGTGGIRRKTYLTEVEGHTPTNFFPYSETGHTDEAKKELMNIFGGRTPFDTPKPTRLIDRILELATDEYSIILDCFAGSGATAHSIIKANKKDHGTRKFILIEMMDYAETTTAERVRRVMTGYPYKGKEEVEIYSKKLTPKNIVKATEFLSEAQGIAELRKDEFAKVSAPKIQDNCIKVIGTKVYDERMEGLGGEFDYYELGAPLFKGEFLNEEVGIDKIREYIYYTETKQPLTREQDADYPYLLDTFHRTSYYFYYEKDGVTRLTNETLGIVKDEHAEQYLIYADVCCLDEQFMKDNHIIFKQIPRNIKRF